MRNLKRALSLALASVMLMGMMVVGSSAASFPDVDDNDNIEAIDVLETVQVMIGNENGDFEPDKNVTRAEMAVVMAKLLNLDYKYYETTCPFNDVPDWAKGWVGACAANGIVSGRGDGVYDSNSTVTAVEAASMMMRALGYFKYPGDYEGGFEASTVKQASKIGLFAGINGNARDPMNRDQVAKLALNTLEARMVDFTGNVGMEIPGVGNVGYSSKYDFRTGTQSKYRAIAEDGSWSDISTQGQYYVQLGEQLYDGKLKLDTSGTDDFGRPSRTWGYDGKTIGTYAKNNLLTKEYVGKVTSADLYSLLGASTLKNNELVVYIDGVADKAVNNAVFEATDLSRTNTKAVGGTGNGVLTQVFVDPADELITVSIINTYLAEATADYSEKKASLSLKAYKVSVDGKNNVIKKDATATVTAYSEDFPLVEDAEKGDFFLVTLSGGKVQSIVEAPVVEDVTLNSFKKDTSVTGGGTTYNYASTAMYDATVLDNYNQSNMKDTTYKLYLDQYDNLIGIEIVDEELNYVFITGVEAFGSTLGTAKAEAFGIFPDGTSGRITVKDAGNVKTAGNSSWSMWAINGQASINQWYTYTTDKNGDYTLGRIPYALKTDGVDYKVAQGYDDKTTKIDKSHVSLIGDQTKNPTEGERAYGNDETIYLLTKTGKVGGNDIITGVETMTIGVNNADIKVQTVGCPVGSIYLYNSKGYIIAAVVNGEENGTAKDYAFILDDKPTQEDYDSDADEWTWYRKAIVNGEEVELKERGSKLSYLGSDGDDGNMTQYKWFRVSYDKEGYVVGTSSKSNTAATWTDKTPVDFAASDNAEAIYVGSTVYFNTWTAFDANKVALIYQEMNTTDSKLGLTLNSFTLYAYDDRNTADTGIHLKRDANAVLIETNVDGDRVIRYFDDGDGHDNVDAALNAMKKDANGKNKFTGAVYYVMKDGEATTIIIVDNDAQKSEGIDKPGSNGFKVKRIDFTTHKIYFNTADWVTPNNTVEEATKAIAQAMDSAGWAIDGDVDGTTNPWEIKAIDMKTGNPAKITFTINLE